MNKQFFEKELMNKVGISSKDAKLVNDVLEENSIIGKKSKENIINELVNLLEVDEDRANEIYNAAMDVIKDGVKKKLKHPFKSLD